MAPASITVYQSPLQAEEIKESPQEIFQRLSRDKDDRFREVARAIIEAESSFNPKAKNPDSSATGLFQITKATKEDYCPEANLLDPEENILCAFKMLEKEEYWRWSESADVWTTRINSEYIPEDCSCIKSARASGVKIPIGTNAEDLKSNSTPQVGALALFSYDGLDHAGKVTKLEQEGFWIYEGNFNRCRTTERFIKWEDPALRGFHKSNF